VYIVDGKKIAAQGVEMLPASVIDFLEGREMEVGAIFEAPLHRASELGVSTPLVATLTGQMRILGRRATRTE